MPRPLPGNDTFGSTETVYGGDRGKGVFNEDWERVAVMVVGGVKWEYWDLKLMASLQKTFSGASSLTNKIPVSTKYLLKSGPFTQNMTLAH